jgi:hypothetical protein
MKQCNLSVGTVSFYINLTGVAGGKKINRPNETGPKENMKPTHTVVLGVYSHFTTQAKGGKREDGIIKYALFCGTGV